ncbi:esterase [Pusillimonas sp. TS35]|uniref:esterase n=1 Tax=Paracandidimonas lactea TaxID=2895524 RepID=UPI00136D99FE|nr:esterase [Paracandidimonas lactea]MYN12871.1 esterase [Pusillimonas sp. TS35]
MISHPADAATATLPPLKAIRGFHVGGAATLISGTSGKLASVPGLPPRISDPNGQCITGQMYVQQYAQAQPAMPCPIYLWHGGGMTGCTWEDTPDGRPGWLDYFLRQGCDVLVSDAVERGRASWPAHALDRSRPEHRTIEQAWAMFRIGTVAKENSQPRYVAHPGQRFPTAHVEQLARQFVPRWTMHRDLMIDAYCALLKQCGAGVVIAHSEGARLAQAVAQRVPHLIKALVLVEPAGGVAENDHTATAMRHIPVCTVWGDYFDTSECWREYRRQADAWTALLARNGATTHCIDLPALGVRGNSHLPMMDNNSADIAAQIHAWLEDVLT